MQPVLLGCRKAGLEALNLSGGQLLRTSIILAGTSGMADTVLRWLRLSDWHGCHDQ